MRTTMQAGLIFLIAFLLSSATSTDAQDSSAEIAPEVVLDAYSAGFYRPVLHYYAPETDSIRAPELLPAAKAFTERLRFAIEWSGYVMLFDVDDIRRYGPPEVPAGSGPPIELHLALVPADSVLVATVGLAEPEEPPFYQGKVRFNLARAKSAADAAAEELLRQLTGMTPPFRSRIACVEEQANDVKELVLLDYDGSNRFQLTHDLSIALSPSWSADGRKIVFCSFRGGETADLYIVDLDDRIIRPLVQRPGTDAAPSWSPDGKWIVFAGSQGTKTNLFLVRSDGSGLQNLTYSSSINTSPSWSPTGWDIVFMSDRSGSPQIYRMDRDGSNLLRLTYEGGYNADPAWSPSGDRIVYVRLDNKGFQLRLMDPSGDVDIPLTDEWGDHLEPSWSPDGMKITYSYQGNLWVMNSDGTRRRKLKGKGLMPDWSPIPAQADSSGGS